MGKGDRERKGTGRKVRIEEMVHVQEREGERKERNKVRIQKPGEERRRRGERDATC